MEGVVQPVRLLIDLPEVCARRGDYLVSRPSDPIYPGSLVQLLDQETLDYVIDQLRRVAPQGGSPPMPLGRPRLRVL